MRFVAGGDAVAELLLAGALWRRCWQGRCGGVAGRGSVAERLQRGGAVAELAGRGAVAELLAGAPWRSAIGKMLLARGAAVAEILLAGALWREAALWQRC